VLQFDQLKEFEGIKEYLEKYGIEVHGPAKTEFIYN